MEQKKIEIIEKKITKLKIFGMLLILTGLLITGYVDWRLSIGLFLALYGNNLEMSSKIIKTILDSVKK